MKVLKFGGTSVGNTKNIQSVIKIVADNQSKKEKQFVVVSAFSGVTDMLLNGMQAVVKEERTVAEVINELKAKYEKVINNLLEENQVKNTVNQFISTQFEALEQFYKGLSLIKEITPKTSAKIVSFGELTSSFVITEAMKLNNINANRIDARELIVANGDYFNAIVDFNTTNQRIQKIVSNSSCDVLLVGGFVAANTNKETTVLGRGGSDYSAAIIAAAIDADSLEIWTDVSGMYTANPRAVKNAKAITEITYREAMELSHFGAKVIYPPTIHPVLNKQIPIKIKNTFAPQDVGTLISNVAVDPNPVKGITHVENIALLTLQGSGMVGVTGVSKRLFEALSQQNINVKFITQASSEHTICVGVDDAFEEKAKDAIDTAFEFEISRGKINPLTVENNLAIVACVGDNMKNYQGLSGKMFSTLGKNNINVRAIAQGASENNISAVVNKKDAKKALNSLHEAFFEDDLKQINVFITGVGNVGEKLVEQIKQQQNYLINELKLNIRIAGISNSRKMLFSLNGINLDSWKEDLNNSETAASLPAFLEKVNNFNLRNSIFVDVTANGDVANMYKSYLKNSIAVVACNKIAASAAFEQYNELKMLSKKYNAPYLFETNVGAGLPVIDTLNNLIASGDKIKSIYAVLSGSLNFVFNNFNENTTFYDVVKQAQEEGYTEPDPRIDLSGVDVARKILILARESGLQIELNDIENTSFLTKNNNTADSVADFYETLKTDEAHFQQLYASAKAKNCQLKYVASLKDGKASVGLQEIPVDHPFYNLQGKDNIVMFYTERYPEQPMIVKGAGAGAEVTASGIFADIIRAGNN